MSVEDRPTPYQLARVDALEHELRDVEDSFTALTKGELAAVNAKLKAKGLPEIVIHAPPPGAVSGGGAPAHEIVDHLLGLRLVNFHAAAAETADRD